jgi:hypothetical protein
MVNVMTGEVEKKEISFPLPSAVPYRLVSWCNPSSSAEKQRKRMIGDCRALEVQIGYINSVFCRGIEINVVEPGANPPNSLEVR